MKPTADTPLRDYNRAIVLRPLASAEESVRDGEARLLEAVGLAQALGLDVASAEAAPLRQISPRTYFGSGRVERMKDQSEELGAGVIVIDAALSPVQQRNLETDTGSKVIDRTGLILEIFGLRARTKEGKLQVELARQGYERSRLVRTWTHLERQRGGLGKTGGPGETQIELDRRIIADRIIKLKRELEDVRRTRGLQRRARSRAGLPAVVLVGYTNAGKSTLFNRMTRASVLEADMLFATLDPTLRAIALPRGEKVILSDTVGFISDLPTMLVAAFRATLEEVIESDIILHVRDVSHQDTEAQMQDVEKVLRELGIEDEGHERLIEVWNKIDLLDAEGRAQLVNLAARVPQDREPVLVSAVTGEGLDRLTAMIAERLSRKRTQLALMLDPADGAGISWLHRNTEVVERHTEADGRVAMTVRADPAKADQVRAKFGAALLH